MAKFLHEKNHAKLGSMWHEDTTRLHRAGTLIHEMSHKVARTGDHVNRLDKNYQMVVDSTQAAQIENDFVESKTGLTGKAAWAAYPAVRQAEKEAEEAAERAKAASSQKKLDGKIEKGKEKEEKAKAKEDKRRGKAGKGKKDPAPAEASSSKKERKKERHQVPADPPELRVTQRIQRLDDGPIARGSACKLPIFIISITTLILLRYRYQNTAT
jgi:hypothetical protein